MLDKDLFASRLNNSELIFFREIMIKKHIKLMHSQYRGQNVIHIFYLYILPTSGFKLTGRVINTNF